MSFHVGGHVMFNCLYLWSICGGGMLATRSKTIGRTEFTLRMAMIVRSPAQYRKILLVEQSDRLHELCFQLASCFFSSQQNEIMRYEKKVDCFFLITWIVFMFYLKTYLTQVRRSNHAVCVVLWSLKYEKRTDWFIEIECE